MTSCVCLLIDYLLACYSYILAVNLSNQAPMIPQSRVECKLDILRIPSPPPWPIGKGIADSVEIYKKPGYQ